jgi:formylglycine-generating enzyme required for sulfatase activity
LAVSTKEVTFEQFHIFQSQRSQTTRYARAPVCPVNGVTWYEATAYCNWLSEQDPQLTKADWCYAEKVGPGMPLFPDALSRRGYRLPTEAEWEYYCRAKTRTSRPFGESEELLPTFAWTWLNSGDQLHPVGTLLPNEFGLFDVLGNAYEWCHDGQWENDSIAYIPYPRGSTTSPANDDDDTRRRSLDNNTWRMMRGGAFCFAPASSRSAARFTVYVTMNFPYTGFRVVRTLPENGR